MKKIQQSFVAGLIFLAMAGCSKTGSSIDHVIVKAQASEVKPAKALLPVHAQMTIPAWAQGKVISEVRVKPGVKVVALTFDDGPWPHYTHRVLDTLKRYHIKATFFMVGHELSKRPDVGRDVVAAGEVIGDHSWDHPAKPHNAAAQVINTDAEIAKELMVTTHLFRPPYGILKNGMAAQAKREKHAVILWSSDGGDWKKPAPSRIANTVLSQVRPGAIILLHDGGGNRSRTVAALPLIIPRLQQRGYKFVTVPQLLEMRYVPPMSAKKLHPRKPGKKKKK